MGREAHTTAGKETGGTGVQRTGGTGVEGAGGTVRWLCEINHIGGFGYRPNLESMHELSMAASIVDVVTESVAAYPGATVKEVRLRVGALSAVVEDSLKFCWELTTLGTPLEGATLVVRMMPVVIHCVGCGIEAELEGVQSFRCPRCGEPARDLRQGRELEIESIEIEEPDSEPAGQRVSESAGHL